MRVFYCLFLSCLLFSCTDSESDRGCTPVVFDEIRYNTNENFVVDLKEFSLDESCLTVKLGITGCDGENKIDMVSSGLLSPSTGTALFFDFYDYNQQPCEPYFIVEREYDLDPIKELTSDEIIIRFRNSELTFNYPN